MTMIDPEIQQYMDRQRLQNWIGSLAQGFMKAAAGRQGFGTGLLQGIAGANAGGGGPMDALRLQAQMEQLTAGRKDRERERRQDFAAQALAAGPRYDPETEILWNQLPMKGQEPRPTASDEAQALLSQADPGLYLKGMAGQMSPGPAKPPPMRDVTSGEEHLEQIFSPDHPNADEFGYVTTHRGPRYKPGANVTVEAPDISGLSGLMTATQRGQEIAALKESRGAAVTMVDQGYSLINSLRESGNQAVSWSGSLARGVNTIASQGEAIAKNFGIQMGDGSISKALNENDWDWGELDEESSVIKSKLLGLAVAITKADQGSRPSDFDVQTSIARIAGNSGNAATTAAVIEDLLDEKMRGFSHRYNLAAPDYELAPFNWDETLSTLGIERPKAPTPDDPLGILD